MPLLFGRDSTTNNNTEIVVRAACHSSRASEMVRVAREIISSLSTISGSQVRDTNMPRVRGKCIQFMITLG